MKIHVSKKMALMVALGLCFALLCGCSPSLTSAQKREFAGLQSKGLTVEEKNPGAAAALGILPGGGSFYTGQYGLGVVDLLFWPLSILWDPINGYSAANVTNYYATKEDVRIRIAKDMDSLDEKLEDGLLTEKEYVLAKREVKKQYETY